MFADTFQKKHQLLSKTFNDIHRKIFSLEDISVSFGSIHALKQVNLTVEMGEILFITGDSGAGKTTLLRILSGELVPNSGRAFLPNGDFTNSPFTAKVFQDLRLMADKTCRENLMLSFDRRAYISKGSFTNDMFELSRILGIHNRLDLKVSKANGGLKQKVAIIRALLSKPDILLLDEPTNSLDKENTKKIFELLNLYNVKQKLTIIWASHNTEIVKKFSGRIVHLKAGRLIYTGHACFI